MNLVWSVKNVLIVNIIIINVVVINVIPPDENAWLQANPGIRPKLNTTCSEKREERKTVAYVIQGKHPSHNCCKFESGKQNPVIRFCIFTHSSNILNIYFSFSFIQFYLDAIALLSLDIYEKYINSSYKLIYIKKGNPSLFG